VIGEQEINFRNGTVKLAGTVIGPAGTGPFPGVVLLHGSGPEGRWASRYLATEFARHGIAALIYDKRGVGASTGDWRRAGFAELVGDASAAVKALRALPGIDPARVGIHGHSQGGTISPWVASDNPGVAFVIGSAASGVSMTEAEIYSLSNAIGVSRIQEPDRSLAERFIEAIVATAYGGAPRKQLESAWQAVRDRPWAFQPPPESDPYWSFSRLTATYDPLGYWRRVAVPALLVYGENDERVPVHKSAARISDAYLGGLGTRLSVRIFPDADHTFRLRSPSSDHFEWPRSAPGYPEAVIRWVLEITRAGGT
jgi:dipeptidyl aminopeptidase/acylaminoacyl peptidase